jgi:hypothetical protein
MTMHRSAGFTLIEILGVLVITAVIGTGVWSVTESVTRGQLQSMDDVDRSTAVAAIDRVLRNAVRQATLGTLAAPNVGPVQVVVSGGGTGDTLVVLRAEASPITNSTRPCPGGGACLHLVGDHSARLEQGQILLVSAPAMGARVYQVTAAPRATRAVCGADCEEETVCPTYATQPASPVTVVVRGLLYRGGSPTPEVLTSCPQTFYADGTTRCVEERALAAAPRPKRLRQCVARGRVSAYTEVPVADLTTSAFRFPAGGAVPTQSGAALTPRVRTQVVTASRFFVRQEGTRGAPVLVRQTGLAAGGAWNAAAPVGGPVSALQVETLHAGESAWRRGVGVDDAALAHSTSNSNYAYTSAPTAGGDPGFAFRRGYHDVGAVRIRFTVPTSRGGGPTEQVPYTVVVATNGATRGGSEGGW